MTLRQALAGCLTARRAPSVSQFLPTTRPVLGAGCALPALRRTHWTAAVPVRGTLNSLAAPRTPLGLTTSRAASLSAGLGLPPAGPRAPSKASPAFPETRPGPVLSLRRVSTQPGPSPPNPSSSPESKLNPSYRNPYSYLHRNTEAQLLPYKTYKARYIFKPYAINFDIYYHYLIAAVLDASRVLFRYFDRGLVELLGPYGLVKFFHYLAFKLEVSATAFIPHYAFYIFAGAMALASAFTSVQLPGYMSAVFLYCFLTG